MTANPWVKITAQNTEYWEALAPYRLGEPIAFFRQGGSTLTDEERAAVGDVAGRRVLQLACSTGDEAITFAQLGADVTAVDIAPSHLTTAQAKATEVGVRVEFLEQDMMSLDASLTGFDIIYISWGGICWVPDIDSWARSLAHRLTPGGMLMISEHDPVWEVLTSRADGTLGVGGDYFTAARDGYPDPDKAPQVIREIGIPATTPRSYIWNLGRVVTAVLGAGLGCGRCASSPTSRTIRASERAQCISRRPTC
jgi:SAM-dependent methyltransferase